MNPPHITHKQQAIIRLLYQHRFLNRAQIQTLMGHTEKRRISIWLKDLREKQYIEWIYSTNFIEKTKPAIYYLSLNGIRSLRAAHAYPDSELRKRYRDSNRSEAFVAHELLLADCCLQLLAQTGPHIQYRYATRADVADPTHPYHAMSYQDSVQPDLCFTKQTPSGSSTYLLGLFDTPLPRYRFGRHIKHYIEYLLYGDWENELQTEDPPIILLVCPSTSDLIYAKRRTRTLITDKVDDCSQISIRFTTATELRTHGPASEIWEPI